MPKDRPNFTRLVTPESIILQAPLSDGTNISFYFPPALDERVTAPGSRYAHPERCSIQLSPTEFNPWYPTHRGALPEAMHAEIKLAFEWAVEEEGKRGKPAVGNDVAARFRRTCPDMTVSEIRAAAEVQWMSEPEANLHEKQAAWVARNFIHREDHQEKVDDLQADLDDAERAADETRTKSEQPDEDLERILDAVHRLRLYREAALEHRPGATIIDQIIDLIDEMAPAA